MQMIAFATTLRTFFTASPVNHLKFWDIPSACEPHKLADKDSKRIPKTPYSQAKTHGHSAEETNATPSKRHGRCSSKHPEREEITSSTLPTTIIIDLLLHMPKGECGEATWENLHHYVHTLQDSSPTMHLLANTTFVSSPTKILLAPAVRLTSRLGHTPSLSATYTTTAMQYCISRSKTPSTFSKTTLKPSTSKTHHIVHTSLLIFS